MTFGFNVEQDGHAVVAGDIAQALPQVATFAAFTQAPVPGAVDAGVESIQ